MDFAFPRAMYESGGFLIALAAEYVVKVFLPRLEMIPQCSFVMYLLLYCVVTSYD